MNHSEGSAYGLWGLTIINSLIFIFFAFSFFKPQTKRDWRTFGSFSAFIVALFAEMFPILVWTYVAILPEAALILFGGGSCLKKMAFSMKSIDGAEGSYENN